MRLGLTHYVKHSVGKLLATSDHVYNFKMYEGAGFANFLYLQ